MKLEIKTEIKIFLTFFLIYSFFASWVGWNENSRFFLIRSIVDENRLDIGSFYNQTTDRSFYNGHYYSDKDPGISFFSIPVYYSWKVIYDIFPENFRNTYNGTNQYSTTFVSENKTPIFDYTNPGFFTLTSMILLVIFTSSLFSALTVTLVYKISKYFTKNEKHRLLLVFTFGLGTLALPYGIVFYEQAISTFIIFLTFYLLIKIKQDKITDKKYFALAGILVGYMVTVQIVTIILFIFYFIYVLLSKNKVYILLFVLGALLGILPLVFYNYSIFGTFLESTRLHLDPSIWPPPRGEFTILRTPNIFVILRSLFDLRRGLFFYYPILIFSFIGLYYLYKKFKAETILIISIFILFLLLSVRLMWREGASFGARYFTPTMPFLMIPLLYIFDKFKKNKILKYLVILSIALSILVNFIGLQPLRDEVISENKIDIMPGYGKRITTTFDIFLNPLYDYYLPLFLQNGPRSRIVDSVINCDSIIDCRQNPISRDPSLPPVNPWISSIFALSFIAIVLSFIWRKEIFRKNMNEYILFLAALIILQVYFIRKICIQPFVFIFISFCILFYTIFSYINKKIILSKFDILKFFVLFFIFLALETTFLFLIKKDFLYKNIKELFSEEDNLLPQNSLNQSISLFLIPLLLSLAFFDKKYSKTKVIVIFLIMIIFVDISYYKNYETSWLLWKTANTFEPYKSVFSNKGLMVYVDNCKTQKEVEREVVINKDKKSLYIQACANMTGHDGIYLNLSIDDKIKDAVFIPSYICGDYYFNITQIADGKNHDIKIKAVEYGDCNSEDFSSSQIKLLPSEAKENFYRNIKFNGPSLRFDKYGIELGVGSCDNSSSIESSVKLSESSKYLFIRALARFAGGDGAIINVSVDNSVLKSTLIPSNSAIEVYYGISKYADNRDHKIKIESQIYGNCDDEAPIISVVRID